MWLHDGDEVRAAYPHLRRFHESMSHEAVAALPLVLEGEPIGGMALSFADRRAFDDEERAYLTSIADLTAQAIDLRLAQAPTLALSKSTQAMFRAYREKVAFVKKDRIFTPDIAASTLFVQTLPTP